jgi:broad specificity phosphatase PhoE
MAVLLVRHAKAGDRSSWTGPDEERPLSGKGRRQAGALIDALGDWKPKRVLSSRYARCVETVDPIAKKLGLRVERIDSLVEGAAIRDTLRLIDEVLADGDAVLCSHGDVIPAVIDALIERDGLELPDEYGWAKGSTWILEGSPGHVTAARYIAPPR